MTTNEHKLEKLKIEHEKYRTELEQLQLSVDDNKQYEGSLVTIDKQLTTIRSKLDRSYNKILNLQEKIALELKARRL